MSATKRLERIAAALRARRGPTVFGWVGLDETEDQAFERMIGDGRLRANERHRVLFVRWQRAHETTGL